MRKYLDEVKTSLEGIMRINGAVVDLKPIGKPRVMMFNGYRPEREKLVKCIFQMAPKNANAYSYGNCACSPHMWTSTSVPIQFYCHKRDI